MSQSNIQNLTIVLTSSENFVWSSMQEIIPHLERCWLMSASESHQVELIDVDQTPLKEIVKIALRSHNIVLTCFNLRLVNVLNLIRQKMSVSSRVIFHLHNQATIGLWPLKTFGMLDYLNSQDIFISSCSRDLNSLFLSIENAKAFLVPFSLKEEDLLDMIKLRSRPFHKKLYYVGRISRQKNIHLIIEAIKLLKDEQINIEFNIYGEEDQLGSPNMGTKDSAYLNEISALISKYDLEDLVHLRGYIQREKLYQNELSERQIFISASSHSDENFGMALYRALIKGDLAVVSDWGGHSDFANKFKNQLNYFSILPQNKSGLTANANEIKNKIKGAINTTGSIPIDLNFLDYLSEKNIAQEFSKIISTPTEDIKPLKLTNLFKNINEARIKFKEHPTQIFNDYDDPNAIEFLKAYGLKT